MNPLHLESVQIDALIVRQSIDPAWPKTYVFFVAKALGLLWVVMEILVFEPQNTQNTRKKNVKCCSTRLSFNFVEAIGATILFR